MDPQIAREMMTNAQAFLDASRRHLVHGYLPRIRRAVESLSRDDIWWRPNEASNSVGNLLLHLEGNLRQWIIGGAGGAPDTRARDAEFEASAGTAPELDGEALVDHVTRAVTDADTTLSNLAVDRLLDRRTIQGTDVSVLEAIYHAVEHFSMHTGQILYIAKLRTGEDLGLYRRDGDRMRENW